MVGMRLVHGAELDPELEAARVTVQLVRRERIDALGEVVGGCGIVDLYAEVRHRRGDTDGRENLRRRYTSKTSGRSSSSRRKRKKKVVKTAKKTIACSDVIVIPAIC
jgi:hypothetical protein